MKKNSLSFILPIVLGAILFLSAACTGAPKPTPEHTSGSIEPALRNMIATATVIHPPALDKNLLTADGVAFACDASQPDAVHCQTADSVTVCFGKRVGDAS
ncbi:MAG: hypothetical protein NZ553_13815, partial [Caldilinea sp.]|nr:hypothetical protein [Caldilinea sp.]MDW8441549.1 hypothetical protein [Caldilineaceae bacterium]